MKRNNKMFVKKTALNKYNKYIFDVDEKHYNLLKNSTIFYKVAGLSFRDKGEYFECTFITEKEFCNTEEILEEIVILTKNIILEKIRACNKALEILEQYNV
jgi:hypothetical protein